MSKKSRIPLSQQQQEKIERWLKWLDNNQFYWGWSYEEKIEEIRNRPSFERTQTQFKQLEAFVKTVEKRRYKNKRRNQTHSVLVERKRTLGTFWKRF